MGSQVQPLSYLRLGGAFTDADDATLGPTHRGDDLITTELREFKDDARSPNKPSESYYRYDGVTTETTTSPATWTAQVMPTSGWSVTGDAVAGWREHTDGNRLSTTRGDCLEVVGGNYKLIVMGRVVGDNVGRSYWESSGGHNHDSTSTPGEVTSITWDAGTEDGTWLVTEETVRGNVVSYFEGKQEEHYFGPSIESIVGPGTSADKSFNTTAPALVEQKYAKSITGLTKADTITETTHINANGSKIEYLDSSRVNDYKGSCPLGEIEQASDTLYADTIDVKHKFNTRCIHSIGMLACGITMANELTTYKGYKFAVSVGATFAIKLAASASLNMGGGVSIAFTHKGEWTFGVKLDFKLGLLLLGTLKSTAAVLWEGLVAASEAHAAACMTTLPAARFIN